MIGEYFEIYLMVNVNIKLFIYFYTIMNRTNFFIENLYQQKYGILFFEKYILLFLLHL